MTNLLYIDPGTGSMLFSVFIALIASATFVLRALLLKLKFILALGKQVKLDSANKGLVIFTDDKRYWNLFSPICREADSRGVALNYYTQSADDPALKEKFSNVKCTFIGEGNRGFAFMNLLVADIVLSTTPGLDVYQWKRSKSVKYYVHILHGTDDMCNYKMFSMDSYDAVLLTGDFQKKIIRRLEDLHGAKEKELTTTGYAVMDELVKKWKEYKKTATPNKIKTILLAPSWGG